MSNVDTGSTIVSGARTKKEYEKGVLSFPDRDREIKIMWATELLLGRDETCDIALPDNRVSRKHAVAQLEYDAAKLVDLTSSNGTTRNGEKVESAIILNDGDNINLGGAVNIDVKLREEDETVKSILLKHGNREYLLTQTDVLIGRHPVATDIQIDDIMAASIHAQIEFVFDDAIITCLDPEKEMVVNGTAGKSVKLTHYSQIKLGDTTIIWRF